MAAQEREESRFLHARLLPARYEAREVWAMVQEPFQPRAKSGNLLQQLVIEHLDREERDQADHRAHLEALRAAGEAEDVVEELVRVVPQVDALTSHIGHRGGDVEEVLEEFGGEVLVDVIALRELQR